MEGDHVSAISSARDLLTVEHINLLNFSVNKYS